MEASTSASGALPVSCSNTARSAAATRSPRLRSEMSAILPRTSRRLPPVRDVAHAQNKHLPARQARLADRDFRGKELAALALRPGFTRGQVNRRIARRGRQSLQRLGDALVDGDLGNEQIDSLPEELRLPVPEYSLARGIEALDHPVLVDGQHDVLDVIQDDLDR